MLKTYFCEIITYITLAWFGIAAPILVLPF